jgi:diguanylate cyclase
MVRKIHSPRPMAQDPYTRTLNAGEPVFSQGDSGSEAYLIKTGRVEIIANADGERRSLAILGPDEIFGEMALAGDQTRTASAVALEPTVLTRITHEYLQDRLQQADPMVRHLLNVTLERCRDALHWLRGAGAQAAPPVVRERPVGARDDQRWMVERVRAEQDLERALRNEEFQLHYQPIMRLADGSVAGFEALLRWVRPDGQRVSPAEFIPVAEASGLILPLGRWVFARACRDAGQLQALRAGEPLFMNMNLSMRQMQDEGLLTFLGQQISQQGLDPVTVKIEITESLMMNHLNDAQIFFAACKALGVQLAVDDFGTGYSSLSYLHRLPVDTLKLDRSFLADLGQNPGALRIVSGICRLAHDLGMEVVAEGIETAGHAAILTQAGVDYGQGFRYAPGLPLEQAAAYLRQASAAQPA